MKALNKLEILSSELCYTAYSEEFPDTLVGVYTSIEDASLDTNLPIEDLLKVVDNPNKTLGDCYWRAECFYLPVNVTGHLETNFTKTRQGKHKHLRTATGVVQIDQRTNIEVARYHSVYEATKTTGINNIMNCCKGKARAAGGFKWMFAAEYDELF